MKKYKCRFCPKDDKREAPSRSTTCGRPECEEKRRFVQRQYRENLRDRKQLGTQDQSSFLSRALQEAAAHSTIVFPEYENTRDKWARRKLQEMSERIARRDERIRNE